MTGIILDVAVVVITVLLLIFGIWRGMYKLIFGLVSALLAVILAIVLVSPVSNFLVEKTLLDERLVAVVDEPLNNTIPNGDIEIELYDLDGDGVPNELGFTMNEETHPFADALAGSPLSMLSGVFESAISSHLDKESNANVTFIGILSSIVVSYIIMAIVFIVLLIVLSIVVALIMKLIKKFVTHTYLGHFVDRILGAVLGLAIAALIIWGSLAIIRMFATYEWIIPLNNLIESSTITKLLYENNFLYNMIVESLDIKSILDSILSGISSNTTQTTPAAGTEETEQVISNLRSLAIA